MDDSSERVEPFATGGGGSHCDQKELFAAPAGLIPTIVIARASESCSDEQPCYRGIVLYDAKPAAWWCLTEQEISAFMAWATRVFSTLHLVIDAEPDDTINCSPPLQAKPSGVVESHAVTRAAEGPTDPEGMRAALQQLAAGWIARLNPTAPKAQDGVTSPVMTGPLCAHCMETATTSVMPDEASGL